MELYNEIDAVLDPTPYGGATTTCEALIMGVPVVSIAGEGMVGRLGASILKYSNCYHWIADNKKDYIRIAKQIAEKGVRKKSSRIELRNKILQSELCDNSRAAKELENAYINALHIWEKADSR